MQTAVESLNSFSKKLTVEISPQELIPIEQEVAKSYQKRSDIPGFRPGKAPLNLIRKRHKDLINQQLIEEALRKFYTKALDETNINPVSQGKITDLQFDSIESGMRMVIEVETEPEVKLKKYKGLTVEKDIVDISDEMIEDSLQRLREQYATVKEVDQAKEGDYLHFDAQELDKGDVPIIGRKYENLQAQLGSGRFDSEIEKQLIGMEKGDKRIVRTEIQPPPNAEDQQKRVSSLEIHAQKIEEKEFPELDDDFVKNLDDNELESLDQLRSRLQENMKKELEQRSENVFRNRLIDELLRENPFEIPPSMVENYLNAMVKDFQNQAKDKSIDEETIRKEYRASAIRNIRWHFLKDNIIEAENMNVSEEELISMIEQSELDQKTKKQLKSDKHYLGHLKEDILEKKVLGLLKEHAEVTEVYPLKQNVASSSSDGS